MGDTESESSTTDISYDKTDTESDISDDDKSITSDSDNSDDEYYNKLHKNINCTALEWDNLEFEYPDVYPIFMTGKIPSYDEVNNIHSKYLDEYEKINKIRDEYDRKRKKKRDNKEYEDLCELWHRIATISDLLDVITDVIKQCDIYKRSLNFIYLDRAENILRYNIETDIHYNSYLPTMIRVKYHSYILYLIQRKYLMKRLMKEIRFYPKYGIEYQESKERYESLYALQSTL